MKRKFIWIVISTIIMVGILTLTSCTGVYYLTDAEYSDVRESHASVTYYDNQIYWGWHSGYYYYYGIPHYYPWNYYYNSCPPSHYTHTTHVVITRPVNKPTHRPNRPTIRPNRPVKNNTTIKVKTNRNVKINKNSSNKSNNKTFNNRSNKTNTNRNTKRNIRKPR
tara:strand:+ start:1280 stop:1774 length:495 start_codon:yes stop_codon:yes gene_type:complete